MGIGGLPCWTAPEVLELTLSDDTDETLKETFDSQAKYV